MAAVDQKDARFFISEYVTYASHGSLIKELAICRNRRGRVIVKVVA